MNWRSRLNGFSLTDVVDITCGRVWECDINAGDDCSKRSLQNDFFKKCVSYNFWSKFIIKLLKIIQIMQIYLIISFKLIIRLINHIYILKAENVYFRKIYKISIFGTIFKILICGWSFFIWKIWMRFNIHYFLLKI